MKRTSYTFDFYHFNDEEVRGEHLKIFMAIRELLPSAAVEIEPVKTDQWLLTIEVEEE